MSAEGANKDLSIKVIPIWVWLIGISMLIVIPVLVMKKIDRDSQAVATSITDQTNMLAAVAESTGAAMPKEANVSELSEIADRTIYISEIYKYFVTETMYESTEPIQLVENNSNNDLECERIGNEKNFILEMTVSNPNYITDGFDYGIVFRDAGENVHYRLHFIWDYEFYGIWYLYKVIGSGANIEFKEIKWGGMSFLDEKSPTINTMKLIAFNDWGYLFINNMIEAEFALSELFAGDIYICTDMIDELGRTGNVIEFGSIKLQEIMN